MRHISNVLKVQPLATKKVGNKKSGQQKKWATKKVGIKKTIQRGDEASPGVGRRNRDVSNRVRDLPLDFGIGFNSPSGPGPECKSNSVRYLARQTAFGGRHPPDLRDPSVKLVLPIENEKRLK